MQKIIINSRDRTTADLIQTAVKQFPGLAARQVESEQLIEAATLHDYSAIVTDLDPEQAGHADILRKLKQVAPETTLVLVSKGKRPSRLAHQKREFGLFATIQRPIDPFDLARKILRLQTHLIATQPAYASS